MHDRELIKSRSASRHECVPRRHIGKCIPIRMTFFLREQIFNFPYIPRRIVIPPVREEVTFPRSCRERKPRGGRLSNATVRVFEMTRSVLADFDTFSLEFPMTLSDAGNSSSNTVTPETWQLDVGELVGVVGNIGICLRSVPRISNRTLYDLKIWRNRIEFESKLLRDTFQKYFSPFLLHRSQVS